MVSTSRSANGASRRPRRRWRCARKWRRRSRSTGLEPCKTGCAKRACSCAAPSCTSRMFGGLGAWAAIDASGARPPVAEMVAAMREVNFYPSANNWGHMWTNSDPGVVDADFAQIAGLHANTVRIIVQVPAFGYPSPDPTMLDRLAQTISLADRHGF